MARRVPTMLMRGKPQYIAISLKIFPRGHLSADDVSGHGTDNGQCIGMSRRRRVDLPGFLDAQGSTCQYANYQSRNTDRVISLDDHECNNVNLVFQQRSHLLGFSFSFSYFRSITEWD